MGALRRELRHDSAPPCETGGEKLGDPRGRHCTEKMPENAITQKKKKQNMDKMRRTDCAYYSLAAIATRE